MSRSFAMNTVLLFGSQLESFGALKVPVKIVVEIYENHDSQFYTLSIVSTTVLLEVARFSATTKSTVQTVLVVVYSKGKSLGFPPCDLTSTNTSF